LIVYTSIIKGKDLLLNIEKEQGVRYICFSDKKFTHPTWEFQPIEPLGQSDARRIARRYKILSHVYFPNQVTIWVDGRILLNKKPSEMIAKYSGPLSARLHPSRKCVYDEATEIKRINYDNHHIVDKQMKRYRDWDYPAGNGLNETGVVIRQPLAIVEEFNNAWYSELSTSSKRDQLSFNPVAWKLNLEIGIIDRNDVQVFRHRVTTNENF